MNKMQTKFKNKLNSILPFWFMDENKPKWFAKDNAFDKQILTKFHDLYVEALSQQVMHTYQYYTAETVLALIILFDQFPRNMFRNTPQAFTTDHKSLALTKSGIIESLDKNLTNEYRLFFYMPLMHSENLADQEISVKLFAFDDNAHQYAKAHFDIIKEFGRFPHRNKILGRKSTKTELEFLAKKHLDFF